MPSKPTVIAVVNQKGGTGKTTTCENLGIGLVNEGKKVLLVDFDPQGSLTICLGYDTHNLDLKISDLMYSAMTESDIDVKSSILHHEEGVDIIPSNIELSGIEFALSEIKNREKMLKNVLDTVKKDYDFILLDCSPSLGMLTVNALATADNVIIPVLPEYLGAKGLELLLQTIHKTRQKINPKLKIEGILITMLDGRTNDSKEIKQLIHDTYGKNIKIYDQDIPRSVRIAETSKEGKSIYKHDPNGKGSKAYQSLTKEVLNSAEKKRKRQLEQLR